MTSFALKWIAILSMLIDHLGASGLVPYSSPFYWVTRIIGRLAFPLFAFMVAEGFFYTKDFRKYLLRMVLFALISEVPFDLMVTHSFVDWRHQSVFVTFAIALLGLKLFDAFATRNQPLLSLVALLGTGLLAQAFHTDYGAFGVLLVFIFYRYRGEKRKLVLWFSLCVLLYYGLQVVSAIPNRFGMISNAIGGFELFSLVPILLYNRLKGYASRFFQFAFYAFYPAHMLVLYLIVKNTV